MRYELSHRTTYTYARTVDSGQHIRCSDRDGIHFEADQHAILGAVVAAKVREILPA